MEFGDVSVQRGRLSGTDNSFKSNREGSVNRVPLSSERFKQLAKSDENPATLPAGQGLAGRTRAQSNPNPLPPRQGALKGTALERVREEGRSAVAPVAQVRGKSNDIPIPQAKTADRISKEEEDRFRRDTWQFDAATVAMYELIQANSPGGVCLTQSGFNRPLAVQPSKKAGKIDADELFGPMDT